MSWPAVSNHSGLCYITTYCLRLDYCKFILERKKERNRDFEVFPSQHSVSPEVRIHGIPMNNFSHSASRGMRLSKLSIGLDMNEPSTSNWSTTTGVYFKVCGVYYWFSLILTTHFIPLYIQI